MRINPDNKKIRYSGRIDWRNPKEPIWVYPCIPVIIPAAIADPVTASREDCPRHHDQTGATGLFRF